jgi:putative type I restriction enzyme, DNA specificity subunit
MTKMKESGIDWIGQIPEEWEVVRLQDVGDYKKGPFGSAITIDMFIEKSPGSYKVYEQKNAIRGNCEIGEAYIPKSVYNNLKNFSVYPLDIIVSCAGTIGKCYILPEDCEQGIINQALMRVRVNKIVNLEYFLYIFDIVLSYAAIKYSNGSAIKNIPPFNVLNKLRVTLPSNIEQLQIVNYLNKKIAQLDKAKALLEEQIQKLKDYRASLIYETVTKGLDKNVPMKDSGIDWIGQVPQGWGVKAIKYIFDEIGSGSTPKSDNEIFYDGDINWIQSGDLYQTDTVTSVSKTISYQGFKSTSALKIYQPPFVALAMYGASVGNVAVSYIDACVNQAVVVMLGSSEKVGFGKYAIEASKSNLIFSAQGGTQPNISQNLIKNWSIPQPKSEEQDQIVDFLDNETSRIDKLIQIKNQQIENINKQRQTLIYDYVTGKRRV